MDQLTQTRLPGVGTKFTFGLAHGGRLTVIQHNDGMREVYFFRRGEIGRASCRERVSKQV